MFCNSNCADYARRPRTAHLAVLGWAQTVFGMPPSASGRLHAVYSPAMQCGLVWRLGVLAEHGAEKCGATCVIRIPRLRPSKCSMSNFRGPLRRKNSLLGLVLCLFFCIYGPSLLLNFNLLLCTSTPDRASIRSILCAVLICSSRVNVFAGIPAHKVLKRYPDPTVVLIGNSDSNGSDELFDFFSSHVWKRRHCVL